MEKEGLKQMVTAKLAASMVGLVVVKVELTDEKFPDKRLPSFQII